MFDFGKIGDLIRLSWKYWVALALAAGFLLWDPSGGLAGLSRTGWLPEVRFGVECVFALATALSAVAMVEWAVGAGQQTKKERARFRRLHDLTLSEKRVLLPFITEKARTQYVRVDDSVLPVLERDGILARVNSWATNGRQNPYRLEEWAWKYLMNHPQLLHPLWLTDPASLPERQDGTLPLPEPAKPPPPPIPPAPWP